jgi:DNA-binding GntR family transcriptional regulator
MTAKRKELLSETAYKSIRDMIIAHRFIPGLRVNVEEIGRELGMSRPPVWEAIRRLEQDGVFRKIPNRGVFLIKNTFEKLFEQAQMRSPLEDLACRLACKRIDKKNLDRMSRCLARQLKAIENGDLSSYSAADLEFHRLIYIASGNESLKEIFESIILRMTTVPPQLDILSRLPAVFASHQEMFEGIAAGDEKLARVGVDHHTEIVLTHLEMEIQAKAEQEKVLKGIKRRMNSRTPLPKNKVNHGN